MGDPYRIFKNRVRFCVGRNIIYLMSHLRYFEVVISEQCSQETELFYSIREVFEDTLKKITINTNYDMFGGHEYAFWCTKCVDYDKPHLAGQRGHFTFCFPGMLPRQSSD